MSVPQKVQFTEQQVAYLERMFPEILADARTSHAEFLVQTGKRIVVRHLRDAMQKDRP